MKFIYKINFFFILFFFLFITFLSNSNANNFNQDINKVRAEINRDNLSKAIELLGNITVSSSLEKDQINILFGDIYLKMK